MTAALDRLVAAVDAALRDRTLADDRARTESFRPALASLLVDPDPIPAWAHEPLDGGAVGNLVHADAEDRFHVLAVVFPEATSSGIHFHGCWGLIGYLRGGDEETRYRPADDTDTDSDARRVDLVETGRHRWYQGDICALLPPDEGWHRVRNPGPGVGISLHVLCMVPAAHPHRYWRRDDGRVFPFPFTEVAPDRWVAKVAFD